MGMRMEWTFWSKGRGEMWDGNLGDDAASAVSATDSHCAPPLWQERQVRAMLDSWVTGPGGPGDHHPGPKRTQDSTKAKHQPLVHTIY